jgi:hypothetical protein
MNNKNLTNKQVSDLVCNQKWFFVYDQVNNSLSKTVRYEFENKVWDVVWELVENNVATPIKNQLRELYAD